MFKSSDGAVWQQMSARIVSQVPIWNGNRTLDLAHKAQIKENLGSKYEALNINPYRLAQLNNEDGTYSLTIIDGQHRASILADIFRNPYEDDFFVIVACKIYHDEADIIRDFKIFNETKSIKYTADPVLKANEYIEELCRIFNAGKGKTEILIRSYKTVKPYLEVEKVRAEMIRRNVHTWTISPKDFGIHSIEENNKLLSRFIKERREDKAVQKQFTLALFSDWITEK